MKSEGETKHSKCEGKKIKQPENKNASTSKCLSFDWSSGDDDEAEDDDDKELMQDDAARRQKHGNIPGGEPRPDLKSTKGKEEREGKKSRGEGNKTEGQKRRTVMEQASTQRGSNKKTGSYRTMNE